MEIPNLPKNEKKRLEALRNLKLLDTKPEFRFDRITKLARKFLNVPVAVISLVDEDRQWFKSVDGLDVSETPRDISFCGHTILQNEAFIIKDATKDKRFADNPLVTNEPFIRFYCGIPIQEGGGEHIGTICIIDHSPRDISKKEVEILQDLAALAKAEIAVIEAENIEIKLLKN